MLDTLNIQTDMRDDMTFFRSSEDECSACGKIVPREDIRIGKGRLDAGNLSKDLHREYLPTEHGEVFPILYQVLTCPRCYHSVLKSDFLKKPHRETLARIQLQSAIEERKNFLAGLFTEIPRFDKKRDLLSGLASYVLALSSYSMYGTRDCPTARMAVCALRCAWICQHIADHVEEENNLDWYIKLFYRKASFLYDRALYLNAKLEEDLSDMAPVGPDFDKDYGYDGFIYVHALLNVQYGRFHDSVHREEVYKELKKNLSKVFGFGKSSKEKPSALLDIAHDVYLEIESKLRRLNFV